jgi:hypothetical protein
MAGLNNQVHGEIALRIGCALSGGPGTEETNPQNYLKLMLEALED